TLRLGDGGAAGAVAGNIVNNAALVFDRSDAVTYGGVISGAGAVTKQGGNTLTLTGANTYGGDTTVAAGTLKFGNGTAAANTLGGGLTVAGGTALDIHAPASVSLAGEAVLQDGAAVRLQEALRGNATSASASLAAGKVTIGKDVALTLSGIGHQIQHDVPLFSADGGIEGDFARLVLDGYERPVDYLTLTARKSEDQTRYLADYSLTWLNDEGRAHGAFTIASGLTDTIVAALQDVAANAATGWDGRSLTKQGAGSLILAGQNTYTGGTTIAAGTLQLGDGGTRGSVAGDIDIARGSWLSFVRNDDVTYGGAISGAGAVYKGLGPQQGTGMLTLTGDHTYAGGTVIQGGTLRLGDGGTTGSVTGKIVNNAALVFDRGDAVTFDGVISGGGTVTKKGSNTLTLTGDNAYTGLTTIADGTLRLGDGGVSGSMYGPIALADNTALVFDRRDAVTYDGAISGAGTVVKKGSNTLTLRGDSKAYRGITTIEGGLLVLGDRTYYQGMLAGDIVNEGALVFRHVGAWRDTYGDVISGSGSLRHEGGRLILTGENTYTGVTTTTSGSVLQIGDNGTTGSVVGDIDTSNGGLLSFMRNDDVTYDGVISGAGGLYKGEVAQGTGMLTLTGDHTYTGGTHIRGGTLRLGDGGTTGSVAGGINFEDVNAALIFDRGDDVTFDGAIYGRGAVTKQGANTLTLTANSTGYVGVTTVAAGTLRLGDG
ncbi:autotransporter-associated beta strand repeat-containing protein, partial [Achromobacter pulmonis]|uniref:autotransporter-associated beta strand repeat-containing protein n=1 Tax=Achromobacter pulmonis TaxID=1389932 RepID=UPI003C7312FB